MKKKYMLPALKNDVEVDAESCWEKIDMPYDFLISNLRLYYEPNVSVFEGGSNAVPHMFEQMLLFHKAFLDEKNLDHSRAVAEWRAVLSIMALQKVCNVKVDLIRVDLSGENKNLFLKAAYDFRPEDVPVFFNTTWDFLYIVRIKKLPVAIFSPITLVCPAKQFFKKTKQVKQDWFFIMKIDGKEEIKFDFKGEQREILELLKWLKKLKGNLSYSKLLNGKYYNKFERVMEELDYFIQEYERSGQEDRTSPILLGIYSSMNNSIRKEYDFLNNCCDVTVKNVKLRFLIERYIEDIFEERILVLVYDDAPDTMEREGNIQKLKKLYKSILEIEEGKPIIEVYDNGGQRMAACVFMPFKSHFVGELIQNHITPNEFFELFTAVYNTLEKEMDITLQIKEFPYCFRKKYSIENWQFLYGREMEATYIWPTNQVDVVGWKNYYIYTEKRKGTGIVVSVPEAIRQVEYINDSSGGNNTEFQLCKSCSFPAYLCYSYQGVSGFLPIRTKHVGTMEIGSTASIIVDMGHSTTSIAIIKDYGDEVQKYKKKERQDIGFWIPRSCRIAGNQDELNTVRINFVIPDEKNMSSVSSCIKNMLHSFRKYSKRPILEKDGRPFEDGQILFDGSAYLNELQQSIVSYINFEYAKMNEIQREEVHIFIEQLLIYAVYRIIICECSYVRVYFLHCEEKNEKLGELKGLWKNALLNVRLRTGISVAGSEDVVAVRDYEALSCYVYEQIYRMEIMEENRISDDCLDIGMNIGWKNTNVVILSVKSNGKDEKKLTDDEPPLEGNTSKTGREKSGADEGNKDEVEIDGLEEAKKINVNHIVLEYAGRNISMLVDADKLGFPLYPQILKILLNGNQDLVNKSDVERMLEEFGELFDKSKRTKDITHYQGVFDMIAMKIDEANFVSSPDVFNNMYEFRYFLMAITYNIMLLFLNVGVLIRKCKNESIKRINIFLGGNGVKFLKWIVNDKDIKDITQKDADEILILPMKNRIIKYIAKAAGIDKEVEIKIILAKNVDEQMVRGCKTRVFQEDIQLPDFVYKSMGNVPSSEECKEFIEVMKELRQEIFQEFPNLDCKEVDDVKQQAQDVSIVDIIENERKEVCKQVIDEINYINS